MPKHRKTKPADLLPAPAQSAKAAGLRYVSDRGPGIRRQASGKSFSYQDAQGKKLRDPEQLKRVKTLAIPPAWQRVWICPAENGHIQAVGWDAKGRKQYLYHPRWREARDENKYARILAFAAALPKIRQRVKKDLARSGLHREKVVAAVVQLLEKTLIRIGNEEYAKTNQNYGLTTLKNRHVDVAGATLSFKFRGKSSIYHEIDLRDRRLARIVARLQDLPGQDLFQYLDEAGEAQALSSSDVNDYLRGIVGEEFSAKDFRTWAGTVLAAVQLSASGEFQSPTGAKRNITQAIRCVAKRLGNTVAICRKCYVHPAIVEAYLDGTLKKLRVNEEEVLASWEAGERKVLGFLRKRVG